LRAHPRDFVDAYKGVAQAYEQSVQRVRVTVDVPDDVEAVHVLSLGPRLPTWPPGRVGGLSFCTDAVEEGVRGFVVRVLGDQLAPKRPGED
jgi:hypothetical protein